MTSPLWLPFGLLVLAWGAQLTVRGIERTRGSGMGRRAAIYGRIVPGIITVTLFGSSFLGLAVAVGVRALTFWLGTFLLLFTMWGVAGVVGGRLRLADLEAEAEAEAMLLWRSGQPPDQLA